jgi:hypothetical protein
MGVNRGRLALYHISQAPAAGPAREPGQAIAALSDFIEEYPVQPDILNPHNLMMRADGTLVLSDPVFPALTEKPLKTANQGAQAPTFPSQPVQYAHYRPAFRPVLCRPP